MDTFFSISSTTNSIGSLHSFDKLPYTSSVDTCRYFIPYLYTG